MKHYQNIPTESLCLYCKKCTNIYQCPKTANKRPQYAKMLNGFVYECPNFVQDVPFPMKWTEITQKAGFCKTMSKNQVKTFLNSYVRAKTKYEIMYYQALKFAEYYRLRRPLDFYNISPDNYLDKMTNSLYEIISKQNEMVKTRNLKQGTKN